MFCAAVFYVLMAYQNQPEYKDMTATQICALHNDDAPDIMVREACDYMKWPYLDDNADEAQCHNNQQ